MFCVVFARVEGESSLDKLNWLMSQAIPRLGRSYRRINDMGPQVTGPPRKSLGYQFAFILNQPFEEESSLVVRAPDSGPEDLDSIPVPSNTLRVHTEYVLVKSVGPKILWAESQVQATRENFTSVPCLNCGGGDRWWHHLS
ncbi:hypothetical protein TNCV_1598371 [Trichonephila clavipes]|nr:hypothetical protein TNCV_1598371 [Trichonephila clavipes]